MNNPKKDDKVSIDEQHQHKYPLGAHGQTGTVLSVDDKHTHIAVKFERYDLWVDKQHLSGADTQ